MVLMPMSGHISGDSIIVVETRRRWTDEERQRAVDDTRLASVSSVARKYGMAKSLLFRWRKEAGLSRARSDGSGKRRQADDPRGSQRVEGFVPVRIATMPETSLPHSSSAPSASAPVMHEADTIEIELVGGIKLRVSGTVKSEALRQVIAALTNE
jgi:transposase